MISRVLQAALRLVVQVPLGVLIYVFLNRHFRVQAFVEAQKVLSDMGGLRSLWGAETPSADRS